MGLVFQKDILAIEALEFMSQKPFSQKLLIKQGYRILILNSPPDYLAKLGKTEASLFTDPAKQPFDLIQLFVSTNKELEDQLSKVKSLAKEKGLIWVTYPKGKAEINRDTIREYASTIGFKAVSLVAIDNTWSALRLKIV